MAFGNQYAIIVDGYSAGNLLAPEFRSRGFGTVHVQSTKEIWPILKPSYRPDDYDLRFSFTGDMDALVAELKEIPAICILPGTETGVELADALGEELGIPGNGTRFSEARRNKFKMIEACRQSGLEVALQKEVGSADEAILWASEHKLTKVVVKPLKSAGTDNVSVCTTPEEIAEGVTRIVGTTNMLGIENQSALIQEFLEGTEYFLNTVSVDGEPRFTEIWQYHKRTINGHDCVYDRNVLLACDGTIQNKMREYVEGVLDALEISWGPAHTEVMMTPKGPRLVETGARLDGLSVPSVNLACVGYGPLDLTVDAFTDLAAFTAKAPGPYPLKKHAQTVYLTSYEEGTVSQIPGEAMLQALSSFFQMRMRVKPGGKIVKTIDYFTAPGFLTLVHEDPTVIESDYATIRGWERSGRIFTLAGAESSPTP